MKYVVVDATLHSGDELMEEFKAEQHADWEPDYEIGVWKEREVMLAKANQADDGEVTAEGQSTLMVENLKLVKPDKEVEQTTEDVGPKEPVNATECLEESIKGIDLCFSSFSFYVLFVYI